MVGDDIETESGVPLSDSKDAYVEGETPSDRLSRKIDLGDSDPKTVWRQMGAAAASIYEQEIDYNALSQNSNSVIRHVLEAAGIDPKEAGGGDFHSALYPGFHNDLTESPSAPREPYRPGGPKSLHDHVIDGAATAPGAGGDGTRGWEEPARRYAGPQGSARRRTDAPAAPERDVELEQSALRELSAISAEEAVRLKPSAWWTEPEMRGQMRHRDYWSADPSVREPLHDQVAGWHSVHFGDEPVRRDGTGRMIEPVFKIEPLVQPVEPKTADGAPLIQAIGRIAESLAAASATRGRPAAVQRFQAGLNRLKAAEDEEKAALPKDRKSVHRPDPAHKPPALDRVKEDGVFGPKTAAATRKALAARGSRAVEAALDDRDPFGEPSFMAPAPGGQVLRVARD